MKRLVTVCFALASMFVLASCGCYNKMQKKADTIAVTCNPEVLTLRGNTVTADVTVSFPPKYFDKEAIVKITPVLVYQGGEIAGSPKFLQGEYVEDNYTVINKYEGGSYTQTVSFPYNAAAAVSTLELRIEAKCGDMCSNKFQNFVPLAAIAVAQGVNTTQNLMNALSFSQPFTQPSAQDGMALLKDNFSRVSSISEDADIYYLVNQAKVRPAQLTQDQISLFENFVKENVDKDGVKLGTIYAKGYASPEGPVAFNDQLSKKRSESGKDAIEKQLKGVDATYDAAAYGEDWDGFKELVEKSNIKDKDLILKVLSMYSSPVKRDEEIRNMSSVFKVLKEEVLPQLRRTQLVATAEVDGLTDSQLLSAAKNSNNNLNVEEALFAATLANNVNDKVAIYSNAAKKFNDARVYNNLGACQAVAGDLANAAANLKKASSLKSSPEILNNMAFVAIAQGKYAEANQYLNTLSSSASSSAKGLLSLADGNYTAAVKALNGYNKAVAEVCNGNLAAAKSAIANDNSADAEYLKAVIAAQEGNNSSAISFLKSAIAKKNSLKAQAQKDINFAKLFGTSEFLAL